MVMATAVPSLARHAVTPARKKLALAIAAVADLIQLGFFPVFAEGALSPPDDVLDVIVAILLFATLGFKARILIALAAELVPGVALFPSWTAVVATLPVAAPPVPARCRRKSFDREIARSGRMRVETFLLLHPNLLPLLPSLIS